MKETARLHSLTEKLKTRVLEKSVEDWRELLLENYRQFHVLNPENNWISDTIRNHRELLLPEDFNHKTLQDFLEETQVSLQGNAYFMELIKVFPWENAGEFAPIRHKQGKDFFPHMLIFAFTLERMNRLVRSDTEALDYLIRLYWKIRRQNHFYRLSNLLAVIKLHSIELPVILFLKAKRKGRIPANFGKFILSFNIFEAMLVDLMKGLWGNARASLPLIIFNPNYQGLHILPHEKGIPSHFSEDGKAVNLCSPYPLEWADLYQVWNMAFVAQFDEAPYLLIKLLIPSVSSYRNRPTEYMHTRITALHLAMNFIDNAKFSQKISIDLNQLESSSPKFVKLWGEVNRKCAEHYSILVRNRKSS